MIHGYFPVGVYVEFSDDEHVDEKNVRIKLEEYFQKEKKAGTSTFTMSKTDTILGWSKCE